MIFLQFFIFPITNFRQSLVRSPSSPRPAGGAGGRNQTYSVSLTSFLRTGLVGFSPASTTSEACIPVEGIPTGPPIPTINWCISVGFIKKIITPPPFCKSIDIFVVLEEDFELLQYFPIYISILHGMDRIVFGIKKYVIIYNYYMH